MVANVLHTTQATIADSSDAELGKSHWNAIHTDSNGNALEAIIGPFAFASLPAAASYTGVVARVSDVGRTGGSLWISNGTIWRPLAPVKIYENTALITGVSSASEQLLLAMPYSAGVLVGQIFRLLLTVARDSTTDDMTTKIRVGTAGTTADTDIGGGPSLATTVRSYGVEPWYRMASATSIVKIGNANYGATSSWPGAGTSVAVAPAVTITTVASAGYIDITATMAGTTSLPQLSYCAIEIQP